MNKELMKNYADTFMDKVAVIHSAFDETPKTVAFVSVDKKLSDKEKCEIAFMKTNSINDAYPTLHNNKPRTIIDRSFFISIFF